MNFPENLASLINETDSKNMLEILMLNGDTLEIDENLISWSVISASSSKIDVNLVFEKPILVSSGDFSDILFIQVFLSNYTDYNG